MENEKVEAPGVTEDFKRLGDQLNPILAAAPPDIAVILLADYLGQACWRYRKLISVDRVVDDVLRTYRKFKKEHAKGEVDAAKG